MGGQIITSNKTALPPAPAQRMSLRQFFTVCFPREASVRRHARSTKYAW